ncbi:hypothetical protein [Paenibacillus xylanexedens]|uniref:hypothetical protein n=1 Tax=Paenibacillus xylanexedens TaxID=528191 RepID=UPI003B01E30E
MKFPKAAILFLVFFTLLGCNSKEDLLNNSDILPENIIETVLINSNKEIIIYDDIYTEGISTAFLAKGVTGFGNKIIKTGSFLDTNEKSKVSYHVTNHKWSDNENTSIIYGLVNDPQITKLIISDLTKQNFIEISPQMKEIRNRRLWYITLDKPFTSFKLGLQAYNAEGEIVYKVEP